MMKLVLWEKFVEYGEGFLVNFDISSHFFVGLLDIHLQKAMLLDMVRRVCRVDLIFSVEDVVAMAQLNIGIPCPSELHQLLKPE